MNNPVWIDEKGKIIEPEYCRDFLSRHPMRCINDRFYTVDGPLPDENKLKRTIYEEISPWLHDKVAQTVEQVIKWCSWADEPEPTLENTSVYVTEPDGIQYFYCGNTRIRVSEHFSQAGKPMDKLIENVIQYAARNAG